MWFWALLVIGIAFTLVIYLGWVPLNTRYIFLVLLIGGIILSISAYDLSISDLGINYYSIESLAAYGVITIIAGCFLWLRKDVIKLNYAKKNKLLDQKEFYLLFSVPLQEFMARSYPLAIFRHFGWESWIIYVLFSAAIFSFSHIFLRNRQLLIYTFGMGLVWSGIFYIYPDFMSLCLSHFILGSLVNKTKV